MQDSKTGSAARKLYKMIVDMHESFDRLVGTIEETGSLQTQIRDLEARTEQSSQRVG